MPDDAVLTIRVPRALSLRLGREARRQRRSRSAVARDLLTESLGGAAETNLAAEARRQSLRVRRRTSERDTLAFVTAVADVDGWE